VGRQGGLRLGASADRAGGDQCTAAAPHSAEPGFGAGAADHTQRHFTGRGVQILRWPRLESEDGGWCEGVGVQVAQPVAQTVALGQYVQACAWPLPPACAGLRGAWPQAVDGVPPLHGMVHAQAEWQDRAAPVVQDLRVPGHDGPHPPTRMLILQRSPENDGAVCAECATGDERAPVATEPILLQDAGAAGEGVAGGDASGGSHCPAAGSQGESCCGGGGIRGVRGPRRLTAQQKWARVALRMRRSDLRGSIRCVVSESGSGGSRVVADGVDRCQKIACLRSGRELVEVSRRLHSLEATFEVMVDTRVRYAVNARDAGQAELVRELQARLEHLQQRVWKVDHVRVKTADFAELHRQHQEAVAENVRLKMQVSSLERKLVLLDRKAVEATSACRKASESLDRKRRGDVAERSQARMRTLRMRAPLL